MEGFGVYGGPLHFERAIHNARPTGHVAHGWCGTPHYQWTGTIKLHNKVYTVWGYSDTDSISDPPKEFSNDTY